MDTTDQDRTLIERFCSNGDESAFNQIVERHQRDVYRLAYRFAGNHEDAHDLAQEAFVRVYKSLDKFRGDARFKTWLYRIVVNLSLNHVNRAKKQRDRQVAVDDVNLPVAATSLQDVIQQQTREQLHGAIRTLPEKQRKTLILKVFQELKFTEVARVMKCSVGTAKANYFHAVKGLKRRLNVSGSEAR